MPSTAARLFCPVCLAVFRQVFRRCPADGAVLDEIGEEPLLGAVLGGRYLIQSLIGEGGMGRVYFATDETGTGRFAIKVLYGELTAEPRQYERFVREAARAASFEHPNLVRVLDFGSTSGGQPYAVMEHVPGASLSRIIRSGGPLPRERIIPLLGDLCRALAYVHGRGIIHRDVKTGNVLVTDMAGRESAKLFDFGIAMDLSGNEERLTTARHAIGTLSYMSPERALGETFDHRADLFSLGVVLYQMLAGERPFPGPPMMAAVQSMTTRPPRVAERVPGVEVDPALEAISLRLMARDPGERYQSAEEVLRALEEL
ncbi:MAG TPA: serine/threonine-protein kinase [Kofleriaceae bacterium]|nr:serine/threonine-protein kinase [Kofleriaceae bacterium]